MKQLIVASNNLQKVQEMQLSIGSQIALSSYLVYVNEPIVVKETGTSYQANAVAQVLAQPILADDGGLDIVGLPNILGVQTARFFSEHMTDEEKNNKILDKAKYLQGKERVATLSCVLVYLDLLQSRKIVVKERLQFELASEIRGSRGYGFDGILLQPQTKKTLAEISDKEREIWSPRRRAIKQIVARL